MPSSSQLKLIEKILQIQEFKVIDYQIQAEIGIIIRVENKKKQAICPKCGTTSEKLHQNHEFLVRDLSLLNQLVYLKVNRRQFKCAKCQKPFSEDLKIVQPRRSYTKRLAEQIVEKVLSSNLKTVAEQNSLSEDIVERMLRDVAEAKLKEKPKDLKKLGLDEIALVKGQGNYCAVLVDLERHKLIGLLPSRKQEDIRKYWENWGEEILQEIEVVSIDLWKAYKNLVQELMPQAAVIADRFQVMKAVNVELDNRRKAIKKQVDSEPKKSQNQPIIQALKKSQYALLKNQQDLTTLQKQKLEEVKTEIPLLGKMHEFKEEFREIFEKSESWATGLEKLSDWLLTATALFPISCQTVKRWFTEIMGYFESRITQGVVEGINNKLKLIKRSGYGFRNFDNFKLRGLLSWEFNY